MPNQRNIDRLQELTDKIGSAKIVIVTNYAGLSVSDQTDLRQKIAATNGEYTVAKNTLLSRILDKKLGSVPASLEEVLRGPTAVLIAQTDAVASTKILTKFAEDHQLPSIKLALMDDKILSIDEITALSKLPSREQLLANLLAQMQAPAQSMVRVLSANMQNLVYALSALQTKKGGETN